MSKYLIDDQPLIVLPKLAKKIGLNESLFLQQVHYWLLQKNNIRDGYYWTYNSYPEWLKQFPFWSESTLKRTVTKLENEGLIISGNYNSLKIDKTKWYRIDYDKLKEITSDIEEFNGRVSSVQNDTTVVSERNEHNIDMNRPLPEITSKNTPKNKTDIKNNTQSEFDTLLELYNSIDALPKYRALSDKRKSHIKARIKEYGWQDCKDVLIKASHSKFLTDKNNGWFTIDWIFNPTNFLKILEGAYDNKEVRRNEWNARPNEKPSFKETFGTDVGF